MEVQQLTLQILAIHNEVISRNVVIGEVMVPLSSLDLSCDETQIWRDIKPYHFQNVSIVCAQDFLNYLNNLSDKMKSLNP